MFLLAIFFAFVAEVQAASSPLSLAGSVHTGLECASCHSLEKKDGKTMPGIDCSPCHRQVHDKYKESIHGRLRAAGFDAAASCENCHGAHDILPMGNPLSMIHKANVAATCGQCHGTIREEYGRSVHGVAVAQGKADAPTCTDCHGEHSILPPLEKMSRVYPTNIAKTTCPQCHANERINTKYNLPSGKVESFRNTYHGMATEIGDTKSANCASCHGVHNILPSSNPKSMVHRSNITTTCGKCHPNANENFAKGSIHGDHRDQMAGKLFLLVKRIYIFLIAVTIGGYLLHNGIDYFKKLKAIYRRRRQEPGFSRMNKNERIQHMLLFLSFFILVVTGFALKFGWAIPLRNTLHRMAGVLMIGVLVYNIFYLVFTRKGRGILIPILPRFEDARQAFQYSRYLAGKGEKPQFGRFTYWEKIEYWSVVWGSIVMGVTGILMWFENWSLGFMPKWGIDLATLIHYLEAILATLAIIFGHFYFVIINPDVAPMSFTWLMGKIPKHYAFEEHPAEYKNKTPESLEGESQ